MLFHINGLNQNCLCSDIIYRQNIAKKLSKPLNLPFKNVLPVFIMTEQTVLVQSVYVKQRSLLSLHLVRSLAPLNIV